MCGLGGYAGIGSEAFAKTLGIELDLRGGHAAGYVTDKGWATRVGPWEDARRKFARKAGSGTIGILHARFATCGTHTQRDAHPFAIQRIGKPTLYGAHNGMIDDAEDSAREHKRRYTVDSRELFELITDGEYNEIQKLSGYGVAAWMFAGEQAIYLAKLSDSGEIIVCSLQGGGFAFASTWEILEPALVAAKLTAVNSHSLVTGTVYRITPTSLVATEQKGCKLSARYYQNWRKWYCGTDDDELEEYKRDLQRDFLFDPDDRDDDPVSEPSEWRKLAEQSKERTVGLYGTEELSEEDEEEAEWAKWQEHVGKWAHTND